MAGIRFDTKLPYLSPRSFSRKPRLRIAQAKPFLLILGVLALFAWLAPFSRAGVGGSISGTVSDPGGGVVPKSTVTAINTSTGIRQSVTTDNKGFYAFTSLAIGRY